MKKKQRIKNALLIAEIYGGIDGGHHKMWVIDQMVRALTGCPFRHSCDYTKIEPLPLDSVEYEQWVKSCQAGRDGPNTYEWDTGIAP